MTNPIPDLLARQKALDPHQSYIVQAPAGSGKTELLIQRFLKLLTLVEQPESVVALTFTQKAAAEMRERILNALEKTKNNQLNSQPETDQLAASVLQQDKQFNWQLLHSPHRLRIQTIDSLCAELVAKMPLLSKGIPYASIEKDSYAYYQEAAEQCIVQGIQHPLYRDSVEILLLHLGNHHTNCATLLADMLNWREQWLPLIGYTGSFSSTKCRKILEKALKNLQEDAIVQLEEFFSADLQQELHALCAYSESMRESPGLKTDITNSTTTNPTKELFWKKTATLLLTSDNNWRLSVDKRMGFPSSKDAKNNEDKEYWKTMKERMQRVLSYWRETAPQREAVRLALENYRKLPPTTYSNAQWSILEALITLLPFLAAQLKIIFTDSGMTDFSEVSEQASEALGCLGEPSDLALYCDYAIKHLLVDEFQDTSLKQFRLIEKLTQGWEPGDGRTLFIVGDPMQSIYRFREANVSLFLHARNTGIGEVFLPSLTLSSNFRSHPMLIHWVNQCFSTIFSSEDNVHLGAVKHHPSQPGRQDYDYEGNIQFYRSNTAEDQGKWIVEVINAIPAHETVALLVRSRKQLNTILPYLQQENIAYQGVDIDLLSTRTYIQDLCSLTQTILQPANQLAWHATLRAPWCGLTRKDLWALAQDAQKNSLSLSLDGQERFQHVQGIILTARKRRQKVPLSLLIEETWRALGGHLCTRPEIKQDLETFFSLLDDCHYEQPNIMDEVIQKVNKLYSKISKDSHLHIMTIHKSKGLEFDHVILPYLEVSAQKQDSVLFQHVERQTSRGERNFLLASIKSVEDTEDAIYQYLNYLDKKKDIFEQQRLLYVALTRAKSHLHLFTLHPPTEFPTKNTFLEALAPHLPKDISKQPAQQGQKNGHIAPPLSPILTRLSRQYFERLGEKEVVTSSIHQNIHSIHSIHSLTLSFSTNFMQIIGTFIHEHIQQLAENHSLFPPVINTEIAYRRLTELGLYQKTEQEKALHYAERAINNLYQDPLGKWILSRKHNEAQNEYEINYFDKENHVFRTSILDRTFVDTETNLRWIIDYKITLDSLPSGAHSVDLAPTHYRKQLEHYRDLLDHYLQNKDSNTTHRNATHLGLYYPLTKTWISWT